MFPRRWPCFRPTRSFPHAGGDVSTESSTGEDAWSFPHAGGDVSSSVTPSASTAPVFPTQVGMFPSLDSLDAVHQGFPHAGGDVSQTNPAFKSKYAFSPRRWGCFPKVQADPTGYLVFPTQVGMFPSRRRWSVGRGGFPHAGGDVSESERRDCC